jgi:hypothetical protein
MFCVFFRFGILYQGLPGNPALDWKEEEKKVCFFLNVGNNTMIRNQEQALAPRLSQACM